MEKLNLKSLREVAKNLKLKNYSKLTKAALIDLIKTAQTVEQVEDLVEDVEPVVEPVKPVVEPVVVEKTIKTKKPKKIKQENIEFEKGPIVLDLNSSDDNKGRKLKKKMII